MSQIVTAQDVRGQEGHALFKQPPGGKLPSPPCWSTDTTSGVEEQAQMSVPAAVNTTATPGKAYSSLCPKKAV